MGFRLALAVCFVLTFGDVPAFAQIGYPGGGIGYPGGGIGYPGGGVGYPGGGGMGIPGVGGRKGRNNTPSDTVTGKITRISTSQLALDLDDGTSVQIALDRSTRYFNKSGGNAKYGDFDMGDRVSVDASRDNQNYMHALRVNMVDKASGGTQTSSNDNPGSSGDDADKPRLKRAPNSSSSDSSSSTAKAAPATPDDNDPDRPILRRTPQSSAASASSDGSSSANAAPRAQITSPDPTSVAPKPVARESDDPGPPVLKRNAPARVDNTPPAGAETAAKDNDPVAQARAIAERYKNGVPELEATNRPPVQPAPSSAPANSNARVANAAPASPSASPSSDASPSSLAIPDREGLPAGSSPSGVFAGPRSSDPVIQGARDAAAQFTETLPNYVVKQFTTRYQTDAAHGNRTSWQALDVVTADVVCENGKESYKNILVNGKAPKDDVEKTGSWSTGEFATVLQGILSPYTDADFHNKRATTINNHAAIRYDYSVDQPKSGWHVYASSQSYVPGYTGSIWIDKENFRVLRIEMSAVNMPKSFELDAVESAVDYDYVMISEQKYLLPTHSEALSCVRGTAECTRNVIEFRNYKKFGSDSSITFEK